MGVGASSTSKGVNTATCLIAQHYSVCTEQFTVYKCTSVEMAISTKEAPTISTTQRSPLCVVCGQAIVLQHNRFRCNEPDKSKLTKLGDILENVAKRADIQFKITMGAVSHMCRHCREFILRLDKLYQNVLTLQSKLRLQLKQGSVQDTTLSPDREQHHSVNSTSTKQITPKRSSENKRYRSLTPSRQDHDPTVKRPMRSLLPKPTKRLLSSPQTRTGFSPAAKRPTVSQPSTHSVQEKAPSMLSSVSNVINQPTPAQATWQCPIELPFQQEEITIKVYENIEDDEEDNVKVHN